MIAVFSVDEKELILNYGREDRTFNSGIYSQVSIYINGTRDCVDTFINPMLTIGKTGESFKPREDVMFSLQTELYADPVTGTNADEVFEKNGQYSKLVKWRRVVLDGTLAHSFFGSGTGLKVINAYLPGSAAVDGSGILIKYQGNIIKETDYATVNIAPDNFNIGSSTANGVFDNFQISISNEDSGWGDSYTPTEDEIKAYFMGWRMGENTSGFPLYNGTGQKWWARRNDQGTFVDGTGTLPSIQAPTNTFWTPYQLLYQLATPVVKPITAEGQLTFIEGDNQIKLGTGAVLRESVKPYANIEIGHVGINAPSSPNYPGTGLKAKVSKLLKVYRDGRVDNGWSFKPGGDITGGGLEYADIGIVRYDPSAAYSVTYLMSEQYPASDITGTYAKNEKALLHDTVQALQENTARISVLESKKAEKDAPTWITPTLLNGISFNDNNTHRGGYYKNSLNVVQISLALIGPNNNGIPQNATICILPIGYRPAKNIFLTGTTTNVLGLNAQPVTIVINKSGEVALIASVTSPTQISVTVSGCFLAEQ